MPNLQQEQTQPFSRVYYEDTTLDAQQMLGTANNQQVHKAFNDGWLKIVVGTSQVVLIACGAPDFEVNAKAKGWLKLSQNGNCQLFTIFTGQQYDIKVGELYLTIEAFPCRDH